MSMSDQLVMIFYRYLFPSDPSPYTSEDVTHVDAVDSELEADLSVVREANKVHLCTLFA
jgi:hypothetical protein